MLRCTTTIVSASLLCVLGAISLPGAAPSKPPGPEKWPQLLNRCLLDYVQGDHKGVFNQIAKQVQTAPPGPDVHRCLALLRMAFFKSHRADETADVAAARWPPSAKVALGAFEGSVKEVDLVIAATLKYDDEAKRMTSEPLLEKIITKAGPWRDWAVWELARVQSRKMVSLLVDSVGVVDLRPSGTDRERWGCLSKEGSLEIRCRVAYAFLKEHPASYMKQPMVQDIATWRRRQLEDALKSLDDYPIFSPPASWLPPHTPRTQARVKELTDEMKKTLDGQYTEKDGKLAQAWGFLDQFLWLNEHDETDYMWYLEDLVEAKEEATLPPEALKWLEQKEKTSKVERWIVEPGE